MALDFQPYSIVSDTGFTELLTLEPRYNLPSCRYFIEDVVPGIANNINSKLAEVLKDVTYLSLTTDIWRPISHYLPSLVIGYKMVFYKSLLSYM